MSPEDASAVSPADKEQPLREDTRLLGRILGDVIAATRGADAFAVVEATRQAAVGYRRAESGERAKHARDLDARLHALSIEWFHRIIATEDSREGEAAFREKRKPVWKGR